MSDVTTDAGQPPAIAAPAPAPVAIPPMVQPADRAQAIADHAVELDRMRTARAAEEVARKAAESQAAQAQAELVAARAERDSIVLDSTLTMLAGRAVNPRQVVKLVRDAFEVVSGKVQVKGDPAKTADAFLAEWLALPENKHFLSPSVPSGSGAPTNAAAPALAAPVKPDLSTSLGMTDFTRRLDLERARALGLIPGAPTTPSPNGGTQR